jgi:hypothetical protein
MHYPRYEFVVPRDYERFLGGRPPLPRPERPKRTTRPVRRRGLLRKIVRRRDSAPPLAIQEYLGLEFTVDDRR